MYEKKTGQIYYTNRHSCFLLQYHLVLVTKYRKPALTGKVRDSVYSTIKAIMVEKGYNILELNGGEDHVHILFEAGPEMAPLELANIIKTKAARFARRDCPEELAKFYWKPVFWTDSYFVATVSEQSLTAVQQYIKSQ